MDSLTNGSLGTIYNCLGKWLKEIINTACILEPLRERVYREPPPESFAKSYTLKP